MQFACVGEIEGGGGGGKEEVECRKDVRGERLHIQIERGRRPER